VALWIMHTYAFQLRDVSTYVGIESPEKRCGNDDAVVGADDEKITAPA